MLSVLLGLKIFRNDDEFPGRTALLQSGTARPGIEVESPKRVRLARWPDLERIARWRLARPLNRLKV